MRVCSVCGQESPEGFRFCGSCGASLAGEAATLHEVRKRVTVCFCDVTGSTALGERLDPESLRRVMARYFEAMRQVVERHEGTVEKFIGDAVMAVFGVPVLHEDDALRAVRSAAQMREALAELNGELERDYGTTLALRIGLDTGEVVAGTEERLVTGDAVNVAARLEQAAQPGETLIGAETMRLVRDAVEAEPLEPLALRGKSERIAAYRLIAVAPGAEPVRRRLEAQMVGREREQRLLADVWERVCSGRSCQLFTLLGPAGVGKSRLASEFLAAVEDATVLRGRCLSYGEGITYWPVAEMLKQLLGAEAQSRLGELPLDEAAVTALGALLGEEAGLTSTEEIARAVRKLLETEAATRPLVCLFDDVHWGEETFLELVEDVADLSRDAPILLLCLARQELLERRPAWAGGKLNATSVLLEPLSDEECGRLIADLVGRTELAEEVESRIAAGAEGNPLFVEEMLSMLIDDGLLVRDNGRWAATGDLADVRVPPTIQALLAARLDRLGDEERAVIERASVEGKVFHRGSVVQLAPESLRPTVATHLGALVRKELIRPDEPVFAAEDAYRFRHQLIRDAAYDSIPKQLRAELHERHADWLEGRAGERTVEYEEITGYHLEQAYRYRAELGPVDDATLVLAREAAERLGAAASRAFLRRDARAAVSLVSRAASLLPARDPARVNLVPALRMVQGIGGDLSWAHTVLSEAIAAGDGRTKAHAQVQRAFLRLFTEPEVTPRELIEVAEQAIDVFEQLSDELGLARAWRLIAEAQYLARRAGPSAEASEQALVHSRRAGDQLEETEIVEWLTVTLLMGPTPVPEAIGRCEQLLEEVAGKPLHELMVSIVLANLLAMADRLAEAQEVMERAHRLRDERVGRTWFFPNEFGLVTRLADDPITAERELQWGYEVQKTSGGTSHFSTITAFLARALYAQGRDEEADRLSRESEEACRPNDVQANILWRATRALLLARSGELGAAESLAREAVAFAAESDFLDAHGDALMDLAEVLHLAARPQEAATALEEAIQLYEQKGNVVSVARARSQLEKIV